MAGPKDELHIFKPSDDQDLAKILRNLADPVKTSSQTSFKREFGLLKSKKPAPGTLAHHRLITPVVQRCCHEKKFWPAAELEYLLSQQCVSSRNLQMVFESLSERKEVGLMSTALQSQPGGDVPESCLVIALQTVLSANEKTLEKAAKETECDLSIPQDNGAGPCPFSRARSAFVDQILVAPYDEVCLVSSLKKLPFTLVLEMLKYLLHAGRTATDHRYVDMLTLWKGHFLDAHASQLVISKDAHQILVELKKEEDSNVEFTRMLTEELGPLLKQALTMNPFQEPQPQGKYWIETLHLR